MNPDFAIWLVILCLGIGTYLIRLSFLGLIGNRPLPDLALRLLRFVPVAVMPGLVAPLILWPQATGGHPDAPRLLAASVALAVGATTHNTLWSIAAGMITLYAGIFLGGV